MSLGVLIFHLQITSMDSTNSTLSSREMDLCKIRAKSMTHSFRNLLQVCTL